MATTKTPREQIQAIIEDGISACMISAGDRILSEVVRQMLLDVRLPEDLVDEIIYQAIEGRASDAEEGA